MPDQALTLLLILLAGIVIMIALSGSPTLKAVVAAWIIAP